MTNGGRDFGGCWRMFGALVFVGVVAAVLYPVFATARLTGHRPLCISHLKQLGTTTIIYSSDSDDLLPPYYSFDSAAEHMKFYDATMPYCKNSDTYLCPDEELNKPKNDYVRSIEGIAGKFSYVHCLTLKGVIPKFSQRKRILSLVDIKYPEKVAYMRDPMRGFGSIKESNNPGFLSQHGSAFNVMFLDSHVKATVPMDENLL